MRVMSLIAGAMCHAERQRRMGTGAHVASIGPTV
jgi:hypothetical protein